MSSCAVTVAVTHPAVPCGACDASAFIVDDGLSALRAALLLGVVGGSSNSHVPSAELLTHAGRGRTPHRDSGRASTRAGSDERGEEAVRSCLLTHLRARFPTVDGIVVSTVPSHAPPTSEPPVRVWTFVFSSVLLASPCASRSTALCNFQNPFFHILTTRLTHGISSGVGARGVGLVRQQQQRRLWRRCDNAPAVVGVAVAHDAAGLTAGGRGARWTSRC